MSDSRLIQRDLRKQSRDLLEQRLDLSAGPDVLPHILSNTSAALGLGPEDRQAGGRVCVAHLEPRLPLVGREDGAPEPRGRCVRVPERD